ncbi:uncharacterized protein LOC9634169 [Selaginella moellendorffii]|uniref:uncharacterized protein LOC9634169 n=1 Tax=Selaginella moellendorffii TaxID=88036 RepID=UPI000D1CB8BD|nr:uncharacterized protein LOC9634169 [Selaginella moellendorffii]|eukprot:XP_024540331.1 uncharacterized protein LOC9634169 [Selaginella moellendorffii]
MWNSVISSPRPILHTDGARELRKVLISRRNSRSRCCCRAGLGDFPSDGDAFQDFRLWAGKSGLPAAVEAILIEEALAPGEAFAAEEDKLGGAVLPPPPPPEATLSDNILTVLFGAAALGLVVVTVGVLYLAVTDFLENRKNEDLRKQAEEREKRESKSSKKKSAEQINTRAGSKGFGQYVRKESD